MRDEAKDSPVLSPLKDLRDFKIADGDPDIRGWDVFTGEGRRIGEVHDLLIDTAAMKARYLDVHLDPELLTGSGGSPLSADRHVLIPIGRARLDREADRIFVDSVRIEDILDLPEYDHRTLNREQEATLLQRFDRGYVHSPERDFYSHSLYDEDSFYQHRRRGGQAGAGRSETARSQEEVLDNRGIR